MVYLTTCGKQSSNSAKDGPLVEKDRPACAPACCRFHVDDLSSAHVYLRLPASNSIEDIAADTLEDCAQLVKANSIQGNKLNNISVVYTPWANLKKTQSMDVGQVCMRHPQRSLHHHLRLVSSLMLRLPFVLGILRIAL